MFKINFKEHIKDR